MFVPAYVIPDFDARRNPEQSKRYLECLCRCLVDLNLLYIAQNPNTPTLYASGVRYRRDPPGVEDWQTIPEILDRRFADCKSLAAMRVAEILARGGKAFVQFHWRDQNDGATWHIYVQYLDGRQEDPSALLGMTKEL